MIMWRYDVLAVACVSCPLCEAKVNRKCKRKGGKSNGVEMSIVHIARRKALQVWRQSFPDDYKVKLGEFTKDKRKHTRTRKSAEIFERDG